MCPIDTDTKTMCSCAASNDDGLPHPCCYGAYLIRHITSLTHAAMHRTSCRPESLLSPARYAERREDYAAVASIDSALSLIHSAAVSASGTGMIVDSGCMKALGSMGRMIKS